METRSTLPTSGARATAIPMPESRAVQRLQTKVVDGQENPWTNIWTFKWFEVQNTAPPPPTSTPQAFIVIGKKDVDKLPADIQK